jgi:CheY-like chemotaxis protein
VLVADDNRDAADILGGLFMLAGAEVRVAYDGPSAAAIAVEFHPDAGVFDVNMPRMDGWELARRVRAATGGRPLLLIAVSGAGRPDAARQAAVAGFNLHLTKPADPRELVATLSEFDLWLRAGADDHR